MVSGMRGVYQAARKWLRGRSFEFSDTTGYNSLSGWWTELSPGGRWLLPDRNPLRNVLSFSGVAKEQDCVNRRGGSSDS